MTGAFKPVFCKGAKCRQHGPQLAAWIEPGKDTLFEVFLSVTSHNLSVSQPLITSVALLAHFPYALFCAYLGLRSICPRLRPFAFFVIHYYLLLVGSCYASNLASGDR